LDPKKTILVFSHIHNSFDKKELLKQMPNPNIHDTSLLPSDIVKEPEILNFFMKEMDELLNKYEPGKIENKPDVMKQLVSIKEEREKMIAEHIKQQNEYQDKMNTLISPQSIQQQLNEQTVIIQQLLHEKNQLKEQVKYLENKIKQLIDIQIQKRKEEKRIELPTGNLPIIYINT
jgi:hypothetical protein